jgi:hypothetical protein
MITLLADSSSQGHTDVAARVLGIVAIVIASGSLFLAYRTYRRGGARVKIKATKKVHDVVLYANGPIYGDVVEVVASNHGLASAQVAMMFFDVKGKKGFIEVQPSGPSLPHLLEGLHEETWAPPIEKILNGADVTDNGFARVRAGVRLGNGRYAHSRWFKVSRADLSK